ncbi:MAG TPA: choice-of-anchor D domain-containing protein [Solirubrobacteraceae bacterium]|nr:choice-of-anchor D domain-containing protein [Solirubrobacteraceae bacterium]
MRVRSGVTLVCLLILLAAAGQARASGITNSGDDLRTGWYPGEASLTPELIQGGTFGREWSTKVEGQVYAQPLLYNGTLLVATETNHVYGLNPATGSPEWSQTLPHGTPWNPAEIGCADLTPSIGVTATPVIDSATGIAYLTHKTYASGSSGAGRWWMDAIEMSTGAERPGFPVELGGEAQNIPGLGFNATDELQRPGLLLMEGAVYAAFGSHCDHDPYQGWVFGVSTSGSVKARWAADSDGAGIWQSGAGLTSDGPGKILLSTGNGADPPPPIPGSKPPEELGQAIVRLQVQANGTLKATDFFAPFEAEELNTWDADFGSGGVTGLPSPYFGTGSIPHLAVAVGKDGYVYLLNRDELGGYGMGLHGSDDVVERIGPNGGVWSRPGVWPGEGGWVYIPTASAGHSAGGGSGNLDVYSYALTAEGTPSLHLAAVSSDAFGFTSGAPIITSNGTETGSAVVWVVWSPNGEGKGSELRAYAAKPSSKQPVLLASWPIGQSAKFSTPGVGLGRMYVGTRDEHVIGFGSPVTPPISGGRTEFPLTKVGSTAAKTLTLTANREVTVTQIETTEADFAVGASLPPLPKTLAAGEQMTVPLEFSPKAAGPRAGTLKVSLGGGETLPFSLSGTGQAVGAKLEASPPVVSFGGTTPGHPISESILLKNVGSETLVVQGSTLPKAPFLLESKDLPHELSPNQEVLVPVSFAPSEYGSFSGTLELKTNGGETSVHLLGVSTTPGLLTISPAAIDFGRVTVGSETTRSFTIFNSGGLPVKINISKPPVASEFHATTTLAEGESTIEPGQSVTETVRFAPTVAGAATDEWRIAGQDSSGLHEVRFGGEGALPEAPGTIVPELPGGSVLAFKTPSFGAFLTTAGLLARPGGVVHVRLHCPAQQGACTGTLVLRTARAIRANARTRRPAIVTLAAGRFAIPAGRSATVSVFLTRDARRLLGRLRSIPVRLATVTTAVSGRAEVVHASVVLHAPPRSARH